MAISTSTIMSTSTSTSTSTPHVVESSIRANSLGGDGGGITTQHDDAFVAVVVDDDHPEQQQHQDDNATSSAISSSVNNNNNNTSSNSTENSLYTREELSHCFNLLNRPIWVFDSINKSMWWANNAAVEFWNATSLEELLSRNYKDDMSETAQKKNSDNIERLKRNEQWEDVVSCSFTYVCAQVCELVG